MKKIKVEFIVEVSDELAGLIEQEGMTAKEVRFSLLERASEVLTRPKMRPTTDNAYANSLLAELEQRGFDFENLAFLSDERVKRLIFGKPTRYGYGKEAEEKREAEDRERSRMVFEAGWALGVVFKRPSDNTAMAKVIGARKARPLEIGLGVYSLADLETVRLAELIGVKNIGKESIRELAAMVEDGTVKMAR